VIRSGLLGQLTPVNKVSMEVTSSDRGFLGEIVCAHDGNNRC